jgi:L,D-transpeptidase YcbB
MKPTKTSLFAVLLILLSLLGACKKDKVDAAVAKSFDIDSTQFSAFFDKHPDFKIHQKEILELYRENDFKFVWYDKDGRNDFAEVLYDRASQIEKEGVAAELPYTQEYEKLFADDKRKPDLYKELLISSMYFFYAKNVYDGLDPRHSKQLGWYLPRQKVSYVQYLDELLKDPDKLVKDEETMIAPYYDLRKGLSRYRAIRDQGGWENIELPKGKKTLKPGDTGQAIAKLRTRLMFAGDLSSDSKSNTFDSTLAQAVKAYQDKTNREADAVVNQSMLDELNIPVEERIRTILVNMERCRWLSPDFYKNKEYIAVNIPSFSLDYFKDGQRAIHSNVVVGKELHKTVIFSGKITYLVFSPYWNVPTSIKESEILPALEKDPNYLNRHEMEWEGERIRQRPGPKNSLGLVKFMFPNSNNIYLHDSPAKSLFNKEQRAFSHGCVRVQKARDLAVLLVNDLPGWDAAKVDQAMSSGTEQSVPLKRKIPVYIAYFTAWPDQNGNIAFFEDVYKRDLRLARTLYNEESAKAVTSNHTRSKSRQSRS